MKSKTKYLRIAMFSTLALSLLGLSSCLPLAAGAAAGYVAHGEGYRVQNPIRKTN